MTVVVKIGTSSLTKEDGTISLSAINKLTNEIACVRRSFPKIILVSSGAIGAGLADLGYVDSRPTDPRILQAASAIGQPKLMATYAESFGKYDIPIAQLLMTPDDFFERKRYLHARSTVDELLSANILPIVNENDAIVDDAIRWGDNDRIAALLAQLLNADQLLMLTDTDGVYSQDPNAENSEHVELIREIRSMDNIHADVGGSLSKFGSGGMASKLSAAHMASWAGVTTTIAAADRSNVVINSLEQTGELGTIIYPQAKPLSARKLWIAFAVEPKGSVTVDRGAQEALEENGRSLLAVGVISCEGKFNKSDSVDIVDAEGSVIARGLASVSSDEILIFLNESKEGGASILSNEIVHRDELVLLGAD